MSGDSRCCYEFDGFRVDARKRLLSAGAEVVPLPPKAFDLLLLLVENSGRVLSRGELMEALWPDTAVAEGNVSQNVFLLRKALGEGAGEHRYIVTAPGRGYRFVSRVRPVTDAEDGRGGPVRAAAAPAGRQSIAVLPFHCLSGDPADEYLGHGVAETLSNRLASIGRLTVRAATGAALRQGASEYDPVRAGRRLGVGTVVCGTFQRSGERVRINARIVSVRDGSLEWTGQLDADLTDIFAFQDAIAEQVAAAVAITLTSEEGSRLRHRHTESTEAYLNYLRGRYFWNRRTPGSIRRAARCFEQAIEQDRGYGLAYTGLADCYNILACYSIVSPGEGWPAAKAAANRALEIDGRLAEAHAALAFALMGSEWAWDEVERECRHALALNPEYGFAVVCYAEYCSAFGRHEEAIATIRRAQQVEPLSLIINCDVGWILLRARCYDEAVEQMRHALEMDPHYALAHWTLGWCYQAQGRGGDALAEFEEAARLFEEGTTMLASIGYARAATGDRGQAREVLRRLLAASDTRPVSSYDIALLHAALGERDAAFAALERACVERPFYVVHSRCDPRLDPLRSDARFESLLARIGVNP